MARWLIASGIATLTMIGVWTVINVVADWAAQFRYWLRDRVTPLLEDEDPVFYGPHEDGCACHECGLPPLPPERTWEQMTSHQLPLDDGTRGVDSAGIVRAHEPWRVEAHLSAERERRAPWWEAEHRAAYESLGFDYPSGLMARVQELTP